jgi:hypothetical protein
LAVVDAANSTLKTKDVNITAIIPLNYTTSVTSSRKLLQYLTSADVSILIEYTITFTTVQDVAYQSQMYTTISSNLASSISSGNFNTILTSYAKLLNVFSLLSQNSSIVSLSSVLVSLSSYTTVRVYTQYPTSLPTSAPTVLVTVQDGGYRSLSKAAIAGIIIMCFVVVLLLILLILFYLYKREKDEQAWEDTLTLANLSREDWKIKAESRPQKDSVQFETNVVDDIDEDDIILGLDPLSTQAAGRPPKNAAGQSRQSNFPEPLPDNIIMDISALETLFSEWDNKVDESKESDKPHTSSSQFFIPNIW